MKNPSVSTKSSSKTISSLLRWEPDPAFKRRAKIILQELEKQHPFLILDAGCGRGFYLWAMAKILPQATIWGVDINSRYLTLAKKLAKDFPQVKIKKESLCSLSFPDNYFEAVVATEVLEHIKDDRIALKELFRVLKPGGRLYLTVPSSTYPFWWDPLNWLSERILHRHLPSHIWWLAGIWADHYRLYSPSLLKKRIERAGFALEKIWFATQFCLPFSHFLLYGLGKNLVEKGLFPSLNRFQPSSSPSLFSRFVLEVFSFFDRFNCYFSSSSTAVNLIVKAKKPDFQK